MDDILTAVVRKFGPVALRPVHKGENLFDQMMLSLLVAEWTQWHGAGRVKLVPRQDKMATHLPVDPFLPGVWEQVVPLIRDLYGKETESYRWCMDYYDRFQKLFVDKQARERMI